MNGPNQESVELFLQEASENLQYLREYSGLLQEPQTQARRSRKALHCRAHACGHVRQLRFPAIFRSRREDGAHFSLRHECGADCRYARPPHGIYFRRDLRAGIRSLANQLDRRRKPVR